MTHTGIRWLLGGMMLLGLLGTLTRPVRADVAPPEQPTGGSMQPGSETQVRMAAERVLVEVLPIPNQKKTDDIYLSTELVKANVTADFEMINTGTQDETMTVRFPLANLVGWGDGMGNFPEIENLKVRAGSKDVKTTRVETPNPLDDSYAPMGWAAFDVTFPMGEMLPIQVTYSVKATGYYPVATFGYIFFTGAGWKDSILTADLTLRLPYPASPDNVWQYDPYTVVAKGDFVGNDVRWHWDDFEPTETDDWHINVVAPQAWQAVLKARQDAQANPQDAAAQFALGEATYMAAWSGKRGLRYDDSVKPLAQESRAAFEQTLELNPQDVQAHYRLGLLLYDMLQSDLIAPQDKLNTIELIQTHVDEALRLDPTNEDAAWLADDLKWMRESMATATPTEAPIDTPTPVPTETLTLQPSATRQPTVTRTPRPTETAAQQPSPTWDGSATDDGMLLLPTPTPAPRRTPFDALQDVCCCFSPATGGALILGITLLRRKIHAGSL